MDEIAQAVDAVVAAAIRYDDGVFVDQANKALRIAPWRAVEADGAIGRYRAERRSLHKRSVCLGDAVGFLDFSRRIDRFRVEGLKFGHRGDDLTAPVRSCHERSRSSTLSLPFRCDNWMDFGAKVGLL